METKGLKPWKKGELDVAIYFRHFLGGHKHSSNGNGDEFENKKFKNHLTIRSPSL